MNKDINKTHPSLCKLNEHNCYNYLLSHIGFGEFETASKGDNLDVVTVEGLQKHTIDKTYLERDYVSKSVLKEAILEVKKWEHHDLSESWDVELLKILDTKM